MNHEEQVREKIDTIMRDEAYDGWAGRLTELEFDHMAARIAGLVVDMLKEEELL